VFGFVASLWMTHASSSALPSLKVDDQFALAVMASAYLANRFLLLWRTQERLLPRLIEAGVCAIAFVGSAVLLLELRDFTFAEQTIALALGGAVLLASGAEILRSRASIHTGLLVLLIVAGVQWQWIVTTDWFKDSQAHLAPRFIDSQLYAIEASYRPLPSVIKPGDGIPNPAGQVRLEPGGGIREGGGIVARGNGYLLVSGAGDFYWIDPPERERDLVVRELDIDVPINAADFKKAVRGTAAVRYWNFRVQDVEVVDRAEGFRVFVSHHYWYEDRACYVVRVSSFDSTAASLRAVEAPVVWRTVFESRPCLQVKRFDGAPRFAGEESGGRLARLGEHTLLLTLGDHEHDGLNSEHALAQDPEASYGKIVAISLDDFTSSFRSVGHRNPQGLFVDKDGVVWSTEHGPDGGDELNRIEVGGNYGWPFATYGVQYGRNVWPLSTQPGFHDGYLEPVYAWVPSIGVSNLVGVEADLFEIWRGDLLVTSLRDRGLWRMRIRNNGLVVNERIHLDVRMRDIIEGNRGEIVVWSDENPQLVFLRPSAKRSTPLAAFAMCKGCHKISAGALGIGPSLHGIVGRKIASRAGYQYSAALSAIEGRWDVASLDAYLTNPQQFAPGTSMALQGIADKQERKRIIEYLVGL